jgi:hypothetical protein
MLECDIASLLNAFHSLAHSLARLLRCTIKLICVCVVAVCQRKVLFLSGCPLKTPIIPSRPSPPGSSTQKNDCVAERPNENPTRIAITRQNANGVVVDVVFYVGDAKECSNIDRFEA